MYEIIFLKGPKVLISNIEYSDWQITQDKYPDSYIASISMKSIDFINQYLEREYDFTLSQQEFVRELLSRKEKKDFDITHILEENEQL